MRKIIKLMLNMFFFLLIASYSFCQENPLIGKWEVVEGNSKATFEFFKDDTYIIRYPNEIISKGVYKLISGNQIEIKFITPEGEEKNAKLQFSFFDKGLLKLTYFAEKGAEPAFTIYKRVE